MSPDLLRFLAAEIIENRPSRVVEFGSGVSTLVLALALDKAQHGHLISLESDARHLQQTERMLRKFGVDHHARVVLGPLTWIESDEQKLYWYDISVLEENSRFDLIIVDGPSTAEDPLARYPALITMERRFSDSGVLVLDDAVRAGETEIARKWREKYPQLEFQYIDHEKGTLIVRRPRLAVTTSQLEQNK